MWKDLQPFFFWCQKVLPLTYDNSLSYVEVLYKVVDYLNHVIEDVNQIPDYIRQVISDEHLRELLSGLLDELREQIAASNEKDSDTATHDIDKDEYVWVHHKLYKATRDILAGDRYITEGGDDITPNLEKITIEEMIKDVITALDNEITAREDADGILQGNIDTVQDNLDAEALAREGADSTLQDNIDAEALAREAADGTLQDNIDAEALAREAADGTLQDNIDAEALARGGADSTLQDNIDAVNTKIGSLSDLDTTDKSSIVNAINEIGDIAKRGVVANVKDFGAVGDGINNDYYAIKDAMDYAELNKLSIIYFPNGEYNCAGGRFEIDSSKFTFMGAEKARLNSTGLADGYFIKITSPVASDMGSFARVPLMNITINGNYFTDRNEDGVIGVQVGTDDALVAPHLAMYNVTITRWGVGLQLASAYKSGYFNCAIIACNRGIQVPAAGIQQAVPCTFTNCYVECCHIGIQGLGGGYNSLVFYGGAIEYNRSVLSTCTKIVFYGTRFEHDVLASCDQNLTPRAVYSGFASGGSSTTVKFIGCFFLGLNNFAANVGFWIPNPYVMSSYSGSPMYFVGGTDVSLEMIDCELVDVYYPTATYYIACDKFRGHGNYTNNSIPNGNIIGAASTTETNGFIS